MLIKEILKITGIVSLLFIAPSWADDDEDEYDEDDSLIQIQSKIKEGQETLNKSKRTTGRKKLKLLKTAATSFSEAYTQIYNLEEEDSDIEEQAIKGLKDVHQDADLQKEVKKLEKKVLIYLKKTILSDGQRQKVIQLVDDLSNLDSRRREFKHIKELFVPSADEDEDEDEDE